MGYYNTQKRGEGTRIINEEQWKGGVFLDGTGKDNQKGKSGFKGI